jgi:hypothetical protein
VNKGYHIVMIETGVISPSVAGSPVITTREESSSPGPTELASDRSRSYSRVSPATRAVALHAPPARPLEPTRSLPDAHMALFLSLDFFLSSRALAPMFAAA